MRGDILIFEKYFESTKEEIIHIVDDYLPAVQLMEPEASLGVTILKEDGKEVWKGEISEEKDLGEDDIVYGHIEITPVYENSDSPLRVKLYYSHHKYKKYLIILGQNLEKYLKLSDGSPGLTNEPWNLLPVRGYDRELLRFWHSGLTAPEIENRLGVPPRTTYDLLRKWRIKYGVEVVPYKYRRRKMTKN